MKGFIWGIAAAVVDFLVGFFLHTRGIVMNIAGIVGPIAMIVGIVMLLRGGTFNDSLSTNDDAKSQRQLARGVWLLGFGIPLLLLAFLAWGLWPQPVPTGAP